MTLLIFFILALTAQGKNSGFPWYCGYCLSTIPVSKISTLLELNHLNLIDWLDVQFLGQLQPTCCITLDFSAHFIRRW